MAAVATIKKHIEHKVGDHLMAMGEIAQNGWKDLSKKHSIPLEVTSIPPLSHFSFSIEEALEVRALFVQMMLEEGSLATNMFYPMYAHTVDDVNAYLEAVDLVFGEIRKALDSKDVKQRLIGQPAIAGFKRYTN